MVDFDDEEYKQMICAEVGHVYKPFTLQPNEIINMNQELKIQ